MLDIDYCNGQNCPKSKICQRYTDYLYRKEKKLDTRYARSGIDSECTQFVAKCFTGD